jgi:hypothetical protein
MIPLLSLLKRARHTSLVFLEKRRGIAIRESELVQDVHPDLIQGYLIMRGIHSVALVDCGKKEQKRHTLSL